jgi:hypothetical protein
LSTDLHRLVQKVREHEAVLGACVLAALVVLFLGTPLSRFHKVYYSSADLTQDMTLTRVAPHHAAGNRAVSDPVTQMQPWLMFNRDELRSGHLPLWNTYNGAGCPHLANYQSAVFSPFSLPFYVLSVRAALVASAFFKLWALGFLTFLFLKEIRLRLVPALIGATAFMFSGHNVLLLSMPHVGALVALPAGFLFVEKAIRRIEEWYGRGGPGSGEARPRIFWPMCGLTASFSAGLLGGNPEPFYFSALFVGVYAAVRLVAAWRKIGGRAATREVVRLASAMSAACVLAAGLTAFQTLTFLEYLNASRVLEQRSAFQTPLIPSFWPLLMFPNALGNPATPYTISYDIPPPNFELTNTVYVGGLVVLLAALSLFFVRRDRFVAFFATAATVWIFYAYDFLGASHLFAKLPTLGRAPINRSQAIWLFAVSVCAALCIDHLLKREAARAWLKASVTVGVGVAFLAACMIGIDQLIEQYAYVPSPLHHLFLDYVPRHVRCASVEFAAGLGAVGMLWLTRATWMRAAFASAVLCVVFAETGWLFKDYNPVTPNPMFFPVTPAVAELQKRVGNERLAILNDDVIPPDSNLPYKLSLITNYDGMWVRDYDLLFRDTFGDGHNWRPVLKGSESGLDLFGVEYVLAKWGWVNFDSGMSTHRVAPSAELTRYEILPNGRQVSQIFTARKNRLQAVAVWLGTFPNTVPCNLVFRLGEAATGRTILERKMTSEKIQADIYSNGHVVFASDIHLDPPGRPVLFRFDPIPDSMDKQYRWTISCDDGQGAQPVVAWTRKGIAYKDGASFWGKSTLDEPYLFDFSYELDDFDVVSKIGDYVLYRYKKNPGKYHTVGQAVIASSDKVAMRLPKTLGFDARSTVVLSTDDPNAINAATVIRPCDIPLPQLVKTADSGLVYVVSSDGDSLIHIPDEFTFVANFSWENIETISTADFATYKIVGEDREEAERLGLHTASPTAPDVRPLEIVTDRATYTHLKVERAAPGYLVINEAHYPGWKARVNGVEKPLYRANYAFSAVELPSGPCDVEIEYEPETLRRGAWLGAASALIGLFFLGMSRRTPPFA